MIKIFEVKQLDELKPVASFLASMTEAHSVFAFFGPMGSGKTTLIKELCRQLGVEGEISSPSFSLVNEYITAENKPVYHFDFYRIEKIEEVYDIGYEHYFYSNDLCFIEWPEKIMQLLPESFVKVEISPGLGITERNFKISLQ